MQTSIGRQLRCSPASLVISCIVGITAIIAEFVLVWWNHHHPGIHYWRWLPALATLTIQLYLVRGDLSSVGLMLKPVQGWRYWFRATFILAVAVLCCMEVGLWIWLEIGLKWRVHMISPAKAGSAFFFLCWFSPIVEEAIYRIALCVPLAELLHPWMVVVVSGLVFSVGHIIGGTFNPANLVGGFILGWAYLQSGTICVPVLLHSLGNFVAWAGLVAAWYGRYGA